MVRAQAASAHSSESASFVRGSRFRNEINHGVDEAFAP